MELNLARVLEMTCDCGREFNIRLPDEDAAAKADQVLKKVQEEVLLDKLFGPEDK